MCVMGAIVTQLVADKLTNGVEGGESTHQGIEKGEAPLSPVSLAVKVWLLAEQVASVKWVASKAISAPHFLKQDFGKMQF